MARIVDKDTRIIDIDFGQISVNLIRNAGDSAPTSVTWLQNGSNQLINSLPAATSRGGSFIQYQRVDLSFMTKNNEVMQPVDVSVQRTSSVPFGGSNNGNNFDLIEEYVFVLTRPLNNTEISAATTYNDLYRPLRNLGLDGCEAVFGAGDLGGDDAGWPDQAQMVYAEQRLYATDLGTISTKVNGAIDPLNPDYESIAGIPKLNSINTWGSMGAITGPNLHVYRMVIIPSQDFSLVPLIFANEALIGTTTWEFPATNVSFLCKDPKYTEGEYLTRLANAMNSIPEGGNTA
jgi:hypothetical protein